MIAVKVKSESDLNLIVMGLRLAAKEYESYVQPMVDALQPRIAEQFTRQQADALRIANEIEEQS